MISLIVPAFLNVINAQDKTGNQTLKKNILVETGNDPYVPSPREMHATSPAYRYYSQGFSIVQVNVDDEGNNIIGDAANEPSVAFNLHDPNKISIGWRQFDTISSDFRQAGYGYSEDGGLIWNFPGVIDPGIFRSDPVLGSDGTGNFFYNSLHWDGAQAYWCNVYKSDDGGASWEMGTYAQGGDKQWMSVDRSGGVGAGNLYATWNYIYSICPPHNFTRSTDQNVSFEECSSIPGDPYWGTTFVGPQGELYICGTSLDGNFIVAKSSNAQNASEEVAWDYTVTVYLGGQITSGGTPNLGGLMGQTIITMDSTAGPGNGNVYLLCSVERGSDPCDVMFNRSTDGGLTWDIPVRVNDDPGSNAWQWFGTMSVAPDGRIDVIWLDTRDNPGSYNSALYYSYSLDQGLTWMPNVKLSETFNPHLGWPGLPPQKKMGDYYDMYSDEAGAHLAWAATFNSEQDVYYSVITPSYVGLSEKGRGAFVSLLQNFPNPFKEETTIRYNLLQKGFILLKVYTLAGMEVATLVNETQEAGFHQVIFNTNGLESGIYYYRLQSGDSFETRRLVLLK